MKFAKQLQDYELPEWQGRYLPYTLLKQRLLDIAAGKGDSAVELMTQRMLAAVSPSSSSHPGRSPRSSWSTPDEAWHALVEAEAVKIGTCISRSLEALRSQIISLESSIPENSPSSAGRYLRLHMMESLGKVSETLSRLRSFAELNHAALYKILKKHDKLLQRSDGLGELLDRLVKVAGVCEFSEMDALNEKVSRMLLDLSPGADRGLSVQVARLAEGLGHGPRATEPAHLNDSMGVERILFFFLGSTVALLFTILLLLALPPEDPATFSIDYFLASLSVFRVGISLVLLHWAMGMVGRACDLNGINYVFILGIDPRSKVNQRWLFSRGALLTSLWIFIFGLYTVDYKWTIMPAVGSDTGFNSRSSWHYVLYPSAVVAIFGLYVLVPSRRCRYGYRLSLLACIGRTCAAPFFPVTFADNIVGDVMTSLIKPFSDIPAAICYLASHHPQTQESVHLFKKYGDTCPSWEHGFVSIVIGAGPYWFRLLQCLRRYHDLKTAAHLVNAGKYAASMSVVFVTRFAGPQAFITVSVIATLYAFAWDVVMDWGLSIHDLLGLSQASQERSGASGAYSASATLVAAQNETGTAPHTLPPAAASGELKRKFSFTVYRTAVAVDLLLRLSWVLTLFPMRLYSDRTVNRAILQTVVSTAEIGRRAMWSVLRIEHEQVANASGYRSLLWVPLNLGEAQEQGDFPSAA